MIASVIRLSDDVLAQHHRLAEAPMGRGPELGECEIVRIEVRRDSRGADDTDLSAIDPDDCIIEQRERSPQVPPGPAWFEWKGVKLTSPRFSRSKHLQQIVACRFCFWNI